MRRISIVLSLLWMVLAGTSVVHGKEVMLVAAGSEHDHSELTRSKHEAETAEPDHIAVHLEFVGTYMHKLDEDKNARVGNSFSTIDVIFEGQAAEDVLLVLDIEQQGDARNIGISEAFAEFTLFNEKLMLHAGVIDLTGVFDNGKYANDENSQFARNEFVNNAALGNPDNDLGFAFVYSFTESIMVKFGMQDELGGGGALTSSKPLDDPYIIYELEAGHDLLDGGAFRLWLRETGRGAAARAYGVGGVIDQAMGANLGVTLRGARELPHTVNGVYTNTGSAGRAYTTLSAALEGKCSEASKNVWGIAWGTTHNDQGPSADSAELYYKYAVSDNFTMSLHYVEDFSQMNVANVQADGSTNFGASPASQTVAMRVFLAH